MRIEGARVANTAAFMQQVVLLRGRLAWHLTSVQCLAHDLIVVISCWISKY